MRVDMSAIGMTKIMGHSHSSTRRVCELPTQRTKAYYMFYQGTTDHMFYQGTKDHI